MKISFDNYLFIFKILEIMKKLVSLFIFIVTFQANITAQQTDDTTLVINNYFQTVNDNLIVKTSTLPNANAQSYVNLVQVGNQNTIYIKSLQTGDEQVVNQKGNKNNYEYYNYYSQENSNLKVNQEGNQNSLQIFGENSLMNNATINQKSNYKGMVIKNYIH